MAGFLPLLVICILGGTSFLVRYQKGRFPLNIVALARISLLIVIAVIIGTALYFTYAQFALWQANDFSKYLIPPYQTIHYFAWYAFGKFWAPHLISGVIALFVACIAAYINRRKGGIFFESEESYFIAIGLLASGHPGWIVYIALALLMYLIFSIFSLLFLSQAHRVSFYYGWLAVAISVIALQPILVQYDWYTNFFV